MCELIIDINLLSSYRTCHTDPSKTGIDASFWPNSTQSKLKTHIKDQGHFSKHFDKLSHERCQNGYVTDYLYPQKFCKDDFKFVEAKINGRTNIALQKNYTNFFFKLKDNEELKEHEFCMDMFTSKAGGKELRIKYCRKKEKEQIMHK